MKPDMISYAPMGLGREEASRYCGIGVSKFDQLVADGRLPRPRRIDGRKIWLRQMLEASLFDFPVDGQSEDDEMDRLRALKRGLRPK